MSFIPPDPKYFTITELAVRWNIPENLIERYLDERKLREIDYEVLSYESPTSEKERIVRLTKTLDRYAKNKIDFILSVGPYKDSKLRRILSKEQRINLQHIRNSGY